MTRLCDKICVTIISSEILRGGTAKRERQFISGFIEIMIYYIALDDIFYLNTIVKRESKINIKQTTVFVQCTRTSISIIFIAIQDVWIDTVRYSEI